MGPYLSGFLAGAGHATLLGVMPVVTCALVAMLLCYILRNKHLLDSIYIVVGLAIIGGGIGVFVGSSRSSVVSIMAPVLVTAFSVVIGFIAAKTKKPTLNPEVAMLSISLFVLSMLFSIFYAAGARENAEASEKQTDVLVNPLSYAYCKRLIDDGKYTTDDFKTQCALYLAPPLI
jgi:hypothetical protein